MRRLMIAVYLLLLPPIPVSACIDHGPQPPGWFHERPSFSWGLRGEGAEAIRWDEMPGVSIIAAGSATVILSAVLIRAAVRTARRGRIDPLEPAAPVPLALPFDRPSGLPIRVDSGHERRGPTRVARENPRRPRRNETAASCLAAS